jgi:hypothetical protein
MKKLSLPEAAFARYYVMDTGRDAKAAAIKAGYSENGAAVQGHRLLQRPHVIKEIQRLEALSLKQSGMISSLLTDANATADRSVPAALQSIAEEIRQESDAAVIASLARAYVLAGLKENFDICLGRKKRTLIRFKKTADENGKQVETAEPYHVFDPNPSAANAAAALLLAAPEISGAKVTDDVGEDANAAIRQILQEFHDEVGDK